MAWGNRGAGGDYLDDYYGGRRNYNRPRLHERECNYSPEAKQMKKTKGKRKSGKKGC